MLLQAQSLTKHYRAADGLDPVAVLQDLNLSVAERETIAIVGPSGSGKSTLLHILGGLDRADSGTVQVGGREITTLGAEALAEYRSRTVGFIFQLHHLLPQCTVEENVLIPTLVLPHRDKAALQARARELLEAVGLSHRLRHRPGQLSGGERQRAAVARALIHRPPLLLADEPTGALDRVNAELLTELLCALPATHGCTIITVTHAPEVARRMGRTLELRDGKLGEIS